MPENTSSLRPPERLTGLVGLVDMFGVRPGWGSLLSVVTGAGDRADEWMQHTARRCGTDESSFVVAVDTSEFVTRVFNPICESPYGGHSAAGTAAFLVARGLLARGQQRQRLPSGSTTAVWTDGAEVVVHFPVATTPLKTTRQSLTAVFRRGHPARALAATHSGPGNGFTLVDIGRHPLTLEAPDLSALRAQGIADLTMFHWDAPRRVVTARVFAPGYAIDSDPACAPIAAALGEHLARTVSGLADAEIAVRQVTDRGQEARFKVRTTADDGVSTTRVRGRVWIMDQPEAQGR